MTANNAPRANQLHPVQFSRLSKRGVMLGLSLAQLVTLAIGLIAFTSAVYLGGGILFGLTSPIWVTSVALAFVPVGGRKLIDGHRSPCAGYGEASAASCDSARTWSSRARRARSHSLATPPRSESGSTPRRAPP